MSGISSFYMAWNGEGVPHSRIREFLHDLNSEVLCAGLAKDQRA